MSEHISVVDTDNNCGGGAGTEYLIEFETWGEGSPAIVLLHDGLGSVRQWRDTPKAIAERCGVAVLAYNRPGHGRSRPEPTGAWPTRWLHDQAQLLGLLIREWELQNPLLVGHSDGGSIALLFASGEGVGAPLPNQRCRGVVALAAHSFVEPICGEAITTLRAEPEKMCAALTPFHRHPEAVFNAWSEVWLSDAFQQWDIRQQLSGIKAPTWVVQGDRDEYGSEAQLWTTSEAIGANSTPILLSGRGHLLHHEDPEVVIAVVADAMNRTGTTAKAIDLPPR